MPDPAFPSHLIRVAIPVPLPRLFDYLAPAAGPPARIGSRVRVPFGARELVGVVAALPTAAEAEAGELKAAVEVLDGAPLFAGELLASLQWLARYTHAPLGEVFAAALPGPLRRGEPLPDTNGWAWRLTSDGHAALGSLRAGRPRLLALRLQSGAVEEARLDADAPGQGGADNAGQDDTGVDTPLAALGDGAWRTAARSLAQRGLAERIAVPAARAAPDPRPGPLLHPEQQVAIDAILAARAGFAPFLLDGVTGSGKTEVYLNAISDCLSRDRQALVLVPEIGLTPQLLSRFRARLGVPIHALHSGLSDGERARTWAACLRGEARVVVGTRSAVFLPLPDAGLIIIDEEHDGSFKQLDGIRYHARDFALVRAQALDVPIILGSATPSLESLHNAMTGRYAHLRLSRRAGNAHPPTVRVLDVRKRPLQAGLSPELLDAVAATLAADGQVLVFKNRRGYAPVLLCHDCGWSAQCGQCDAAMTVHAGGRRLQCHHCGARRPAPNACPDCGGLALQSQGAGTERIEELLRERFPHVPVLRIDRGTTSRRDALQSHLEQFGDTRGILVGTQMLAKGHDLPNLTLVAVVGIDEGLFSADFRAPEKLAQLLIQVAGRAGRADRAGQVLLQTHHPEHPLLASLLGGGYGAFAATELALRDAAGFPPFAHLVLFRAEAQQTEQADGFLRLVRHALTEADRAIHANAPVLELSGPLPAPMPRRAGYQRSQLVLSGSARAPLHRVLRSALPVIRASPEARKVRWSLDVDPVDLY
ncbi:MAG: primosomal protein N' [Lysobacter sp.]